MCACDALVYITAVFYAVAVISGVAGAVVAARRIGAVGIYMAVVRRRVCTFVDIGTLATVTDKAGSA